MIDHPWVDAHIHVSNIGADGVQRATFLADLLDVLDSSGADLRFIISCDAALTRRIIDDPDAMLEVNRLIHEWCRQAPGRLYGSCTINPNHLDESLRCMDACFGEWGFVLGALRPLSPARVRLPAGIKTRHLTPALLPAMFHFPKDIARRKTPVNRLDNQVLVRLYEKGFRRYNQ